MTTTPPAEVPLPAASRPLHLFEATGVELEYMIVDERTLAVRPIADRLLHDAGSGWESAVERGPVVWSNELALHVIELKTNGPTPLLAGLGGALQQQVRDLGALLRPLGARLMPTAMHPFMDPHVELRLWPHQSDVIYRTFDRIFDCRGHGWANLQSVHVNLPFAGDDEFGRLHAAIRVVLPILPALAASSPAMEGRLTGLADNRMSVYGGNAARVPSVAGAVVPEPIFTRREYEDVLLGGIYRDLAPLDPEGVLRHEWVNARGCIARFDRGSIEIRVLDVQECPTADLAVAGAAIATVRALVEECHAGQDEQRGWTVAALAAVLRDAIAAGDEAVVRDRSYLRLFGYAGSAPCRARDLWQHLIETEARRDPAFVEWEPALALYGAEGCLARRITRALGADPARADLDRVYRALCDCLERGTLFSGA